MSTITKICVTFYITTCKYYDYGRQLFYEGDFTIGMHLNF